MGPSLLQSNSWFPDEDICPPKSAGASTNFHHGIKLSAPAWDSGVGKDHKRKETEMHSVTILVTKFVLLVNLLNGKITKKIYGI